MYIYFNKMQTSRLRHLACHRASDGVITQSEKVSFNNSLCPIQVRRARTTNMYLDQIEFCKLWPHYTPLITCAFLE